MKNIFALFITCFLLLFSCTKEDDEDTTTTSGDTPDVVKTMTTPSLIFPKDNSQDLISTDIEFVWSEVISNISKVKYVLLIDTSAGFDSANKQSFTSINRTSLEVTSLKPNTTYYWMVEASDDTQYKASATWKFTTEEVTYFTNQSGGTGNTTGTASIPLVPINNAKCLDKDLLFKWTEVDSSTSYTIQIDTNNSFTTSNLREQTFTDIHQTTFDLLPNTEYFWRVISEQATAITYSEVFSFSTVSNAVKNTAPVIEYTNPKNGSSVSTSTNSLLRWQGYDTEDQVSLKYIVYYSEVGKSLEYHETTYSNYSRIPNLQFGKQYQWQIHVVDSSGIKTIGDIFTFYYE